MGRWVALPATASAAGGAPLVPGLLSKDISLSQGIGCRNGYRK
jgi:hypothetical protein